MDFCARKKAHSFSPIGNIFLGKKYDYPILGSEIQAIIFCVMSKTCCKTFSFSILCTELYWVLAFCSKHAPKQHNSISVKPTVYSLGQWASSYSLALVHLIPSWLVWEEIECTLHVALPQRPKNLVQQSRQQALRVYCQNIYCGTKTTHVSAFLY